VHQGVVTMSALEQAVKAGRFVVTAEVGPPKGVNVEPMLEEAQFLSAWVDAVNVTDQQSSVMTMGSLAACRLLKEHGVEPVYQVTCRDRNRIALQSDLLSASALGIENVLCLTGDFISLGDHPQAKPVFDLDSVTLLRAAHQLEEGHDLAGKDLKGAPHFFLGAVVSPGSNPVEPQIFKMQKKVRAGAQFFQTQAVYEPDKFARFMEHVRQLDVPVLAGIILLKSAGMARFMNRNVAGVHVPDEFIEEMSSATDRVQQSIEISARIIREVKDTCQGVHIMALGWERHIPAVLQAAGLAG
jgi:methylenetetrahydrofolate reductase (NADPH)